MPDLTTRSVVPRGCEDGNPCLFVAPSALLEPEGNGGVRRNATFKTMKKTASGAGSLYHDFSSTQAQEPRAAMVDLSLSAMPYDWRQNIMSLQGRILVLSAAGIAATAYVIGVIVYRLYFHPLAKYPGPFWAKITDLYDFYQALSERRAHNFLALHQRYGMEPMGPIGESWSDKSQGRLYDLRLTSYVSMNLRLSKVFTPRHTCHGLTFPADIYGFKANVRKADFFAASQSNPEVTDTFSELYKEPAMKKRKVLSMGFSERSLRDFEGLSDSEY